MDRTRMPRVRLFHWRASEAKPLIELLRAAGYTVDYAGESANGDFRSLRQSGAYACVIDLTRLPSHARYVAAAIRGSKSLRHIPIVFVDGEPEKVERIRKDLPDAVYTSRAKLAAALKRVKPLVDPVVPRQMMQTPATRTAAQKLGIRQDMRVAVIDAPLDYLRAIGPLPAGASLEEDPEEALPIALWFVRDPDSYMNSLPRMRAITAQSRLWVVWPKGGKSGITQTLIRQSALAVGLVDYKICSVNETWSGMLFTRKR
jgi:hypothetical protein